MNRIIIIAASLLAFASCQEMLIEDKADGMISVRLENSPVVEMITKTDAAEGEDTATGTSIDVSGFNVYIDSDNEDFTSLTEKYGTMDEVLAVKAGNYSIYADNVTEEESLAGRGQVRYACHPVTKPVAAGKATSFELKCAMVNTAVSVEFIGNFAQYVDGYKVAVHVVNDDDRVLEYSASDLSVGYFIPSEEIEKELVYSFTGKAKQGNDLAPISGIYSINPKTHLTLQFKIKGDESGNINKPVIEVDTTCDDFTETVTVDPSIKNNN